MTATATRPRKARIELAPIHREVMLNGRCWGATTTDDVWMFDCTEGTGTPWLVWHLPSLASGALTVPVVQYGDLRACRASVPCGGAAQELAWRLEEKRKQQAERLAEVRARCLAAGIRPVRPGEVSPGPVGADREPGDLNGDGR